MSDSQVASQRVFEPKHMKGGSASVLLVIRIAKVECHLSTENLPLSPKCLA